MYKLEDPIYFYLLAIIPIMIVVFLLVLWWKKRTQRKFSNPALLEKIAPNTSTFKNTLKLIMLIFGIAFLVISLVNPKMGSKLKTVKREGVDVVFALDVSKSMLAEDIAPNRLEKAKQIISKIIAKLGSDRVGVIIYAGNAYPLLPITTDHAAANMFLQNANPDMVSSQGTAINEALELAKTYYNNDDQTNRFLIFISDGEDHQEETKQMAQNLATKRQPDILSEIADVANGRYVDGNITDNPVKEISEIIANAQKSEFETKQFSDYKDQFQWFLAIAILFLLLDIFLFDKKTKWVRKVDLFNEEKSKKQLK